MSADQYSIPHSANRTIDIAAVSVSPPSYTTVEIGVVRAERKWSSEAIRKATAELYLLLALAHMVSTLFFLYGSLLPAVFAWL